MSDDELTPHEQRIITLSAQIDTETPEDTVFQHVVLCHLGFPRSRTEARSFERRSGNATLKLEAGELWNGREWIPQPLPYGAIPRLIMISAITRAVQTKSPEVELGHSMSESLRTLGLSETGAVHWRRVAAQASALAAVNLRLGYTVGDKAMTVQGAPIRELTAWAHHDPEQMTLQPSTLKFSLDFFNSLSGCSVPLDPRAVAMLSKYPMALDIYCWLAHRLYRVREPKGQRVTWIELRRQFGLEITDHKNFKRLFRDALSRVSMAYPKAKVTTWGSGLVLHGSPPPIPKTRVVVPYRPR